MNELVELESIRDCLEPGLPAPLASCAPDGTPHISYIQQVQYLDSERVSTSRQVFNRALHTLPDSPFSQALVVCARTGEQYRLELQYLHTDTNGEAFEAMRANLDAIASQLRIGPAFRLRGLDVHRVRRCTRVASERQVPATTRDQLAPIEQLARRLERCTTYQEASQELLDALDDIFDIPYAILFTIDSATRRLLATAGSGGARAMLHTTVEPGAGLPGMAAKRRRLIVTTNLQRSRALAATATGDGDQNLALESPLPGLPDARNAAAIPLILGAELLGVLYLESTRPGAFSGPAEGLLHIIGSHTAAALAARSETALEQPASTRNDPEPGGRPPLQLVYYQADDTILCDAEYIVKGAPDASSGRCSPPTPTQAEPSSQTASYAWTSRSAYPQATTTSRPACSYCADGSQTSTAASHSAASAAAGWS